METGGFKGRSRVVERDELYRLASERFRIPTRAIVNEYGMTEMSSQFYDLTLRNPELDEREARVKLPPPWVRSSVVDVVGKLAHAFSSRVDASGGTCCVIR